MIIQDGTASFIVDDVRDGNCVGDVVFRPFLKDGYIKANGATVNRADYPRLIAFADKYDLWTDTPATEPWKFGEGDGASTFVIPDYRSRVLQGGDSAAVLSAGLPNIIGRIGSTTLSEGPQETFNGLPNPFYATSLARRGIEYGTNHLEYVDFDASRRNAIYGNSTTVQPPAIQLIPQIKY